MSHNVHGTFVSQKINKIRWRPDPFNNAHFFVTGSWDDEQNLIKLWDFNENDEDDDLFPFPVASYNHPGDVTEMKFLNPDYFVASSSHGSACLYKIQTKNEVITLNEGIMWKKLHYFQYDEPSPCTSLALYENDIVTVGEDGRINLLSAQSNIIIRRIDEADSCSLQCVIFLKHNELLTSGLRGQMKIWDLRSKENQPKTTFKLSGDHVTPTCITYHPTQRHLIIAGDELGTLTVWDLRQNTFPVNVLNAHQDSISEIQFHPDNPDQLFSCSSAGEVWHWSTKGRSIMSMDDGETNVWLSLDNLKNKLEVFTIMPNLGKPITSLDLHRNKVLCSCDNEAIYLINGVTRHN